VSLLEIAELSNPGVHYQVAVFGPPPIEPLVSYQGQPLPPLVNHTVGAH
jgi:hypothetical protein